MRSQPSRPSVSLIVRRYPSDATQSYAAAYRGSPLSGVRPNASQFSNLPSFPPCASSDLTQQPHVTSHLHPRSLSGVGQAKTNCGTRMLLVLSLLTLGYSSNGLAGNQMTPKEECEELMNSVLPFAEQMLTKYREFYPFGGTMSIDGKITHTASSTGEEHPALQPLIDLLEQGFRDGAMRRQLKATAIVVDIRTIPPGKKEKQDAVEIRLDHVSGYSVKVIFPYRFSAEGQVEFSPPFAVAGEAKIFGP
jgi:hypothetical protein